MLPQELRKLFWDINVEMFGPTAYPQYCLGRVLEYGSSDEEAIAWMKDTFSESQIIEVIRTEDRFSRFSPEIAKRWAEAYHIPLNQVAALRPPTDPSAPVRRLHLCGTPSSKGKGRMR